MAEGFVQVTEGSGKKLRTFDRVIGVHTVHSEAVFPDISPLPTYGSTAGAFSSLATANSHLIQIMAGATNPVYIVRVVGYVAALATTTSIGQFTLLRLTTAGTGGTAGGFSPLDSTDAATGATVRHNLTASKGTEGSILDEILSVVPNAFSTSLINVTVFDFNYTDGRRKLPRIPAGTANGIAVKSPNAIAAASLLVVAHIIELPY